MERISYESLKNTINPENAVTVFGWNGMNIEVKRYLGMEDMMTFVSTVYNSCFSQDTGKYRPEIKDFVIRHCILEIYANFNLPVDIIERYDIVYQTDVIPEIMKYIDQTQFNAIMIAIDSKIDDRLNANVEKFNRDIQEASDMVDNILSYIKGIFDGIDNDTVKQIAESIADMEFNTDEFITKVVEARKTVEKVQKNTEEESE